MDRNRRWRSTPKHLFEVAVAVNRDLHLSILSLFAERDLTDPALSLEQIGSMLPREAADLEVDDDRLRRSLAQLVEWGHLDESRNESATYRTPEEFQRRNVQWSLTGHGSAVIAALDRAADFLGATASLQTATIDALAQSVARAAELARHGDSDAVEIFMEWQRAEHHLLSLRDNVRQLQRRLAELMRDPSLGDAVLRQAREVIIDYVTRFIQDAEEPAVRVARAIQRLHELGPGVVFERALEGANLAPDPILGDPGPAWLEERHRRLAALEEWFLRGRGGAPPNMERLRRQGRDWVLSFLKVLELRRAHHRLSAGVAQDFTQLARVFARCRDDAQAHRVAIAAFQLHGARHHDLGVATEAGTVVDPAVSATQNPSIEISLHLAPRRQTKGVRRERPVRDVGKARAARARAEVERLRRLEQLRTRLLTRGPVRLSTYASLEYAQYRELLDLLCAALTTAPGPDGTRRHVSSDGRLSITVVDDRPGSWTRIETELGTLECPDFAVSIALRGHDSARAASAESEDGIRR